MYDIDSLEQDLSNKTEKIIYDNLMSQAMISAIEHGNMIDFKKALERQADPNYDPLDSKNPPLIMALVYNQEDMAIILLEHNADINSKNRLGRTPLHIAASCGLKRFVEEALKIPTIKVDALDNKYFSALDFANDAGFDEIASVLKTGVKKAPSFTIAKGGEKVEKSDKDAPQAGRRKMAFIKKP